MNTVQENSIEEFKDSFTEALSESGRPPFLFVGSGISIRYCSIPTWLGLLRSFVENNRGCFKYEFGYYSSKCSNNPSIIASKLAEEFHEYWWKSNDFSESKSTYSHISELNTEIAFKIELAKFVESLKINKAELKEEILLMSQSVISGILTTNWDNFLQEVFPEFQTEIGQKEAIFADQKAIGELYKIHGCTSRPESLVLTSNDYEKFIEKNHYLNAKLLVLFAEYPIIFMGYSLSDTNIELILKNLISCLENDIMQIEKLSNRIFFIEWQTDSCKPTMESSTYTLNSISIPLKKIKTHDFISIWEVLANLPRTLSIRTLRQLQDMVYEFVMTSKPTKKILVNGIEELDDIANLEVVVGFGNISKLQALGVIGLKTKDLMEDILFEQIPQQNYEDIVSKILPSVINKHAYVPFFKYNSKIGNLNPDNSLKLYAGNNYTLTRSSTITIDDYRVASTKARLTRAVSQFVTLKELINKVSVDHAVQQIPYLEIDKIEVDTLRLFLKENWAVYNENENPYSSHYRKCICLLDFLEFATSPILSS